MVLLANKLLHVSAYSGHLQVIAILLKKCLIYIYIYIYMTLFEQNCNNLTMAAIGRNIWLFTC